MEKDSKLIKHASTDIFVHQFLRLFRRLESMKICQINIFLYY